MSQEQEKFKERRRTPRVLGVLVDYTLEGGAVEPKSAFIKDIGAYGICIYIPEDVQKNERLQLSVILYEDGQPIKVKGRVVWREPGGYLGYNNVGIEFTEIGEADREVLIRYIREHSAGEK